MTVDRYVILFFILAPEPATTGRVAVQCCQSNGCHQRPSWRGSSLARLIHGMSSKYIQTMRSVRDKTEWHFVNIRRDAYLCQQNRQSSGSERQTELTFLSVAPPAGHSGCCCGRSSLWVICHTPVKPTKRCWSLSPLEAGWILPKIVQGQCKYFLGPREAFRQQNKRKLTGLLYLHPPTVSH